MLDAIEVNGEYQMPPFSLNANEIGLSPGNMKMLSDAVELLIIQFRTSEALQVGGRRYFGFTGIEAAWQDGQATEVRPETYQRHRRT